MRPIADPGHARGRLLLTWLSTHGYTISSAAKTAHLSFTTFSQLITKQHPNPAAGTLVRVITHLGVPLELLTPELAHAVGRAPSPEAQP